MIKTLLFPSSYFDPKIVDGDLENEYQAAIESGLFEVIIFDYDKWFNEGKLRLTKYVENVQMVVYRGWMMKPEVYDSFYNQLLDNNIELITSPEEYRLMHVFPNTYKIFYPQTAYMEVYPLHEEINVESIKQRFKRFMIKDYVKSVKGTDFPKSFDSSITQEEFNNWMQVFYKYRGDLLTGGICVKEYLDLKRYDGYTNEYRVFYVNNEIISICPNSGQPLFASEVPMAIVKKYQDLNSKYYTIDYAELSDGSWKVIEAGDGSVSGLSQRQDAAAYYRGLYHCLNKEDID